MTSSRRACQVEKLTKTRSPERQPVPEPGATKLLEIVRHKQRVIDCNSDDSDYEISLLKAECMEFRHIAMRAVSAGQILLCACTEETPCRYVAEGAINEGHEKLFALIGRDKKDGAVLDESVPVEMVERQESRYRIVKRDKYCKCGCGKEAGYNVEASGVTRALCASCARGVVARGCPRPSFADENAPKMDNNLDNEMDNNLDNKLDNDRDVKIG